MSGVAVGRAVGEELKPPKGGGRGAGWQRQEARESDRGMNTLVRPVVRQRFSGSGGGLSKHRKVGRPLQVSLLSIVLHNKPAKGSCCLYLSNSSKEELTTSENLFPC